MSLIYNNDEFAAIIISVYIYTYDVMNINIDIVKQLFEVYISRNTKKENIILINKFGITCDINKNNNYYKEYAYKILEENLLTCVLDKLKIIQNLTNLKNDINGNDNENENENENDNENDNDNDNENDNGNDNGNDNDNDNENKNENDNDKKILEKILLKMSSYKNDIKYYCSKKIYISYITEIECIHEKLIFDYGDIKEIKKDLIDTYNKTIVSIYNLDYTIY
jgi:hypothetical protein